MLGWTATFTILLYTSLASFTLLLNHRAMRRELSLTLYAEAEAVEACVELRGAASCATLEELREPQVGAFGPIWLRIVEGSTVVAETPGTPQIEIAGQAQTASGRLELAVDDLLQSRALFRELVAGVPECAVEAIASTTVIATRQRSLALALLVAGLLVLPIAGAGSAMLTRRAVDPLERLSSSISDLEASHLNVRLTLPGAPLEITRLVDEFNALLVRLDQSVEHMQRLTADASHELRTPLTAMRTGVEVFLRRDRSAAEARSLLEELTLEIDRIQHSIESLLAMTHAQTKSALRASWQEVDLSAEALRAVSSLSRLAESTGSRFELDVEPGLLVHGDPNLLRLLISNLLHNALKFTARGSPVGLTVRRDDPTVRVEVTDYGPGVAEADQPFVFDRFYRPAGAAGDSEGSGLGLSIVRWVAEVHGGEVRLRSHAGQRGAAFEVRLPLLPATA